MRPGGSFRRSATSGARAVACMLLALVAIAVRPASAAFEIRPGAIGRWSHLPSELPGAFAWRAQESPLSLAVLHLDPFATPGLGLDAVAIGKARGAWSARAVGSRLAVPDYAEWAGSASLGHSLGSREVWIEGTVLESAPGGPLRDRFALTNAHAFAFAVGMRQRMSSGLGIEAWARDLAAASRASRLGVTRAFGAACSFDLTEQCGLRWEATRGGGGDRVELGFTIRPARSVALREDWAPRAASRVHALDVRGARVGASCWSAEASADLPPSRGVALDLRLGRERTRASSEVAPRRIPSGDPASSLAAPGGGQATRFTRDPLEAWEESEGASGAFDLASLDSLREADSGAPTEDPSVTTPASLVLEPGVQRYLSAQADSIWSIDAAPESLRTRLRAIAPYLSSDPEAELDGGLSSRSSTSRPADAVWTCKETTVTAARSGLPPARRTLLDARMKRGELLASGSWRLGLETGWGAVATRGTHLLVGRGAAALVWGEGLIAPRATLGGPDLLRPRRQGDGPMLVVEQARSGGPLSFAIGREGDRRFIASRTQSPRGGIGLLLSREQEGPIGLSAVFATDGQGRRARLELARIGGEAAIRVGARLRVERGGSRSGWRAELARADVTRFTHTAARGFVRETRVQTALRRHGHTFRVSVAATDRPLGTTRLATSPVRRDLRGQLAISGSMPRRGHWNAEGALFRRREPGRESERIDLRVDLRSGRGLLLEWAHGGEHRASGPRVREAFTLGRACKGERESLNLGLFAVVASGAPSPRWLGLRQSAPRGLYFASRGTLRRGVLSADLKLLHGLEHSMVWGELGVTLALQGGES